MAETLIERLRMKRPRDAYGHANLHNPDGPKAADLIESLSSEIQVMREALENMIPLLRATDALQENGFVDDAVQIARQALATKPQS